LQKRQNLKSRLYQFIINFLRKLLGYDNTSAQDTGAVNREVSMFCPKRNKDFESLQSEMINIISNLDFSEVASKTQGLCRVRIPFQDAHADCFINISNSDITKVYPIELTRKESMTLKNLKELVSE
jgi:hypothetical protein